MFYSAHCLAPRLASALGQLKGYAAKSAFPTQGLFASIALLHTQTPPGALEMGLVASWVACFLPTGKKSSAKSTISFIGGCHPNFLGLEMHWCSSGSISRCGAEQLQSRVAGAAAHPYEQHRALLC